MRTKLAELAASITAIGRGAADHGAAAADGRYQLIAGERRWLASQRAGKATIPAIVRQVSDEQAMEMTIVENLQRADLNPMEQARAFERLSARVQDDAGADGGAHGQRPRVDRELSAAAEAAGGYTDACRVRRTELWACEGAAGAALRSSSRRWRGRWCRCICRCGQTEKYVQGLLNPEMVAKPVQIPERVVDPNVREAEDRLRRSLGLKVTIEDKSGRGKVIIEYAGVDDFDSILAALGQ